MATGGAAVGKGYARAVLPGKKPLEGFYLAATGLSGARLATVTAQVRGQGELWLCLLSSNGWLYSPQTTPLTGRWQEVSLAKALAAADKSLGVYFISRAAQPGGVFEVDDVKVTLAPPLQTYDAEVGPWCLEAEDFAARSSYLVADPEALGGKAIDLEEYPAVAVVMADVVENADILVVGVKPDALGLVVVGGLAAPEGDALVAGDELGARGDAPVRADVPVVVEE